MSRGKLFHAVGPVMENAQLLSWRLVHGTRRSPRAAERRAHSVAMVVTGAHSSFIYDIYDILYMTVQTKRHSTLSPKKANFICIYVNSDPFAEKQVTVCNKI